MSRVPRGTTPIISKGDEGVSPSPTSLRGEGGGKTQLGRRVREQGPEKIYERPSSGKSLEERLPSSSSRGSRFFGRGRGSLPSSRGRGSSSSSSRERGETPPSRRVLSHSESVRPHKEEKTTLHRESARSKSEMRSHLFDDDPAKRIVADIIVHSFFNQGSLQDDPLDSFHDLMNDLHRNVISALKARRNGTLDHNMISKWGYNVDANVVMDIINKHSKGMDNKEREKLQLEATNKLLLALNQDNAVDLFNSLSLEKLRDWAGKSVEDIRSEVLGGSESPSPRKRSPSPQKKSSSRKRPPSPQKRSPSPQKKSPPEEDILLGESESGDGSGISIGSESDSESEIGSEFDE